MCVRGGGGGGHACVVVLTLIEPVITLLQQNWVQCKKTCLQGFDPVGLNQPAKLQTLARNGVSLTIESIQGADHFVRMRTVHVGLCLCCLQAIKADSRVCNKIGSNARKPVFRVFDPVGSNQPAKVQTLPLDTLTAALRPVLMTLRYWRRYFSVYSYSYTL